MEKPTYTAIDYNSKENKVIEERIRNYYLPVKNTFEYMEGLIYPNLQMWYVFFYRKNGGKIKGVLGRERTNNLLDSIL